MSDTANRIVQRCIAPFRNEDDYFEIIFVRSFEIERVQYTLSLNTISNLSPCSCPYMSETNSVCKHESLAERQPGYNICNDTRNKDSARCELQKPAAMIEESTGEPLQYNDLPADERLDPNSMKNISDSADKISKLSERIIFLMKRVKMNLRDFQASTKRRQRNSSSERKRK